MGKLIRSFDWAATPLGAMDTWPQSLCLTMNTMLANGFPQAILWGPELILMYNDACRMVVGEKHPPDLGRPARDVWPEAWDFNKPILEKVMAHAETVYLEDQRFSITRRGHLETAYFTICFSPIRAENGTVGGTLVTLLESTRRVTSEYQARAEIAERRRAEEALRESESRLAAALEIAQLGVWEHHIAAAVSHFDERCCELFGISPGRPLSNQEVFERVHPEDRPRIEDQVRSALKPQGSGLYDTEYRIVRPDGTQRWVTVRGHAIASDGHAGGEPLHFIGTLMDITGRKQVEEALRRSEQHLAAELDAARRLQQVSTHLVQADNIEALYEQILDTAVATVHADFASIQMLHPESENGAELRLLGYRGFDPQSARYWQTVPLNSTTTCGAALRTGQRFIIADTENCDLIAGTRDLDECRRSGIRSGQSTPLLSRSGALLGMISTHWRQPHEITASELRSLDVLARQAADLIERTQAEEALRAREAQLHTLLDAAPLGIYLVDSDFRIRQVNPTALPAFGDIPDLIGRDFDELIHRLWPQEYADEIVQRFRHTLETGEPYFVPELIQKRLDRGASEYYQWQINRIPLPDGRYGVVCYFSDISGQVRARQAIAESEERYHTLFDSIDEGFLILEMISDEAGQPADWRILEYNPSFERHTGLRDAVGRTARELIPDLEEHWFEYFRRVALTGEPLRFENRAGPLDGRWFDVYAFRAGGPESRKIALLFADVSEKKRAEEALRRSEEHVRLLLHSTAEGIYGVDSSQRCTFANAACARLLGYDSPDQLVGERMHELIHHHLPDGSPYHTGECRIFQAFLEGRGVHVDDEVFLRRDGSSFPVEYRSYPVLKDGEIQGLVITFLDITERKRAEMALRQSEERFRLSTEALQGLLYDWNVGAQSVFRSDGLFDLLGYRPQEVSPGAQWLLDRVHPEDRDAVLDRFQKATAARSPAFSSEYRVRHRDGRWIWAWDNSVLLYDQDGGLARMVGNVVDVTIRKHAEAELVAARRSAEQARQAAEAANAAKDHFLAVLSHELRTPLAPAMMTASALEIDQDVPEWLREDMALIRRCIDLEVRLIDDLLDMNRISRGKLELRREEIDAHAKVISAAEICQFDSEEKQLVVEIDLAASCHQVNADAGRLQQIFWNLLKNAIKFTPRGGRITVRSSNPDSRTLRIEVVDTGTGIAPDVLPCLFDAFEQGGKHVTRQFGGMGLGLAISKALTEMQGGQITAASDGPGKGAVFTVELPTTSGRNERQADDPSDTAGCRSLKVLLVEDHADTAHIVGKMLTRAGHQVKTAGSVREALQVAESYGFELLVSDLGLPDGSGLDVIRGLQERDLEVKAIVMSGFGMEQDLERSRKAGFAEHLTKPVDFKTLQAALARAAGHRAAS